ncbi:MAG: aminopeptidase [Flavobacteriales bacterium]|nr:aminopeptidase [Flavobacteriales bacterium]
MNKKRIILFIIAISMVVIGLNWQMIIYGIQQGKGQLNILTRAVDISELITDKNVSDSIKIKLQWIQEIKQFAQDSLGLAETDNYTTYYDQEGQPILWVVTACPPYQMEEYKWDYPILGKLGYKGFFDKNKADTEGKELLDLGYDVDVGEVNAWSTLGWFKDPVLSSMMKKNEGELARLIIHELTHTTVYISDDADFNENLATFIGDNGAAKYMEQKYGVNSSELVNYQNHIVDLEKLAAHFLTGSKQLNTLYEHMSELSDGQKQQLKEGQIGLIMANLDTIRFSSEHKFEHLKSSLFMPNNTFFMTYVMYRGNQKRLDSIFVDQFDSNYDRFIENWK